MLNRVGQQFGNYRLLQFLGRGGFAEVYLGEHVYMQSKAAVKVLYGPLAASEAQRFLHEAQTLVRLEHANIVGIKEFDIKQDIPFLVMHYASNGTLHQHHPRGQRVPLETIVLYVQQVASALQYAHDRQIVHRDVKPENMLIDHNGTLLLSDFGIAVLSSSSHSSVSHGQAGTYLYMAPEQITGKALPASDQYALGIAVYEWLCGEAPFIGSAAEITAKHLHTLPPPLRERGIVIEPQVEMVIRHALEKNPVQRFASVREFALALQSSAQQYKSVQPPVPGRNDSILPSPSPKTPGFTYPTAPPPPVPPRLTPHITRSVDPIMSGKPPSPVVPTIYPGNVGNVPTQPASPSVQPRKTGSSCLVTTLISVVFLVLIVGGSVFALPKISQVISESLFPGVTVAPTLGVTATLTPGVTATLTPGVTATLTPGVTATLTPGVTAAPTQVAIIPIDPNEINDVIAFADSFCDKLAFPLPQEAYNIMSVKYQTDYPDERKFAQEPFFSGRSCGHNRPGIINNVWTVVLYIGTTANYTATIIHDPKSSGKLAVDSIQ